MKSNAFFSVENLDVGYNQTLIRNLSFNLGPGDRLIVYGSNGTGKSTLLQTLLNSNRVRWNIPTSQVLYVHQQTDFHRQTPDDVETYLLHILLYKRPFSRPTTQDYRRVQEVLTKIRLKNQPLQNLSGGQRQKLKMAKGLLLESQVLLLDEPFNAIDETSVQDLSGWLNEILPRTAQVIVLHDFEQIEHLQSPLLWIKPQAWEILSFHDWFTQVDRQFHTWLHKFKPSKPPQSYPLDLLP